MPSTPRPASWKITSAGATMRGGPKRWRLPRSPRSQAEQSAVWGRAIPRARIAMAREVRMNALRYAPYHAKLNRRRGEVVKTLEYLRQEQRIVAENREWIDDRAFESRRALLDGLAQWYIDEAARIDAALMRIRDGGYGKCLDCGKPIAPRRRSELVRPLRSRVAFGGKRGNPRPRHRRERLLRPPGASQRLAQARARDIEVDDELRVRPRRAISRLPRRHAQAGFDQRQIEIQQEGSVHQHEARLALLRVARELAPGQSQIADALDARPGACQRADAVAMPFQDQAKSIADGFEPVRGAVQNQRVIQTARSLHHGAAAAHAPQHRNLAPRAGLAIDFRGDPVRVAEHDEIIFRFPDAQRFALENVRFVGFEQRFIAGEIGARIGKTVIEIFHPIELILCLFYCLLKY